MSSCAYEEVEKQITHKRKQDKFGFTWKNSGAACDAAEFQYLVAAPETCFNSCVCVFGGMLPQGNIFPFLLLQINST